MFFVHFSAWVRWCLVRARLSSGAGVHGCCLLLELNLAFVCSARLHIAMLWSYVSCWVCWTFPLRRLYEDRRCCVLSLRLKCFCSSHLRACVMRVLFRAQLIASSHVHGCCLLLELISGVSSCTALLYTLICWLYYSSCECRIILSRVLIFG